jgi:hypothetical protein
LVNFKATGPGPATIHSAFVAVGKAIVGSVAVAACLSVPALGAASTDTSGAWRRFFDLTNPYVSANYTYDSNLLRLDDIAPAPETRWDQYVTLGLGFASDVQYSQQRFVVDAVYNPRWYHTYSEYNYNGGNASAIWHWTGNETLTGTLGYRFRRSLRDFANELWNPVRPGRFKSMRNENRILGSVDYDLPDNWKLGARGDYADIVFSSTKSLDLKRTSGGVATTYVSRAGNELGMDLDVINGVYDSAGAADFTQYTIGPVLKWKYTVRTQLVATVGYTSRHNKGIKPSTFGSATYRATFTIADAGRGSLKASAWRELSNLGDEIADYTIVDGVSLEPGWTLSNGLNLQVRGSYEHRNFETSAGSTGRIDDVGAVSCSAEWPIGRHLTVSGSFTTERRSSTRLYQDYEFIQQQLQITGTF